MKEGKKEKEISNRQVTEKQGLVGHSPQILSGDILSLLVDANWGVCLYILKDLPFGHKDVILPKDTYRGEQ